MTLLELRQALKVLDNEFAKWASERVTRLPIYEAFSDLSEYLLKNHARMDRMNVNIHKLMQKTDTKP